MNIELIRTLYDYNAWANQRILDTTTKLTPEQRQTKGVASFGSIHDTLVHTMSGHWIWLSRWQGHSPTTMFKPEDFVDLEAIRARWAPIEQDTKDLIKSLNDTALARTISYTTGGRSKAFPLWQMMLHQANHATQHRSEIAVMLTQFGHSPGWFDMILYLDPQYQ